jgi:16S rRNA (guanine527-N7)-methyltransferase
VKNLENKTPFQLFCIPLTPTHNPRQSISQPLFHEELLLSTHKEGILKNGARDVGVVLDQKMVQAFLLYLRELKEWNQKINLTSIKDDEAIIINHFIDSLSIIPHLPSTATLLDLGSGAGFPGVPLKIAAPALTITLLEATRKKANFLRHLTRILGLPQITVVESRAEKFCEACPNHPGFDFVIARALAPLETFLRLGYSLAHQGGYLVAMKGEKADEELKKSQAILNQFSLKVDKKILFHLPPTNKKRYLIFMKKE